jgi:hypothetical protein
VSACERQGGGGGAQWEVAPPSFVCVHACVQAEKAMQECGFGALRLLARMKVTMSGAQARGGFSCMGAG